MKKYLCALATLLLAGCVADSELDFPYVPTAPNPEYRVNESQIPSMENSALKGNGDDALKLCRHYEYYVLDHQNAMYWLHIAAENGNAPAEKHLAELLQADNNDPRHYLRSSFWFAKAAE